MPHLWRDMRYSTPQPGRARRRSSAHDRAHGRHRARRDERDDRHGPRGARRSAAVRAIRRIAGLDLHRQLRPTDSASRSSTTGRSKRIIRRSARSRRTRRSSVTVRTRGRAERVTAKSVTGSYFPLLGQQPQIGRLFDPSDDTRGERTAVLTDAVLGAPVRAAIPACSGRASRSTADATRSSACCRGRVGPARARRGAVHGGALAGAEAEGAVLHDGARRG